MKDFLSNRIGAMAFALGIFSILNINLQSVRAQGAAFTYQGRLADQGVSASGIYDVRFTIYDLATNGTSVVGPLTNSAAVVSNGLFTVALDFGSDVFDGSDRWLEIAIRTNGDAGNFTALSPRQQITSTPYAIRSANAGSANSVLASNISGAISLAQLPAAIVTNGATGVNISGSFTGNGAGVTNIGLGGVKTFGNFLWQPEFSTNVVLSGGGSQVFAVDLNGDGVPDLVVNGGANVEAFTNTGAGTFTLASTTPLISQPWGIAVADFNRDGAMDVLVAGATVNSNLLILTNNGFGHFVLSQTVPFGNTPNAVVTGDFNNHGWMDAVVGTLDTNEVFVFTNNHAGGLVLSSVPATGQKCRTLATADLNGDGRMDLINSDDLAGSFSVLTNSGSAFVLASTNLTPGIFTYDVVSLDVTGDGRTELLFGNLANPGSPGIIVFTNDGGGRFTFASTGGSSPVYGLAAGDVNGDGKMDLMAGVQGQGYEIQILTNNGGGGFGFGSAGVVPAGNTPLAIAAADLNGDGLADTVGFNVYEGSLSIYMSRMRLNATTLAGTINGVAMLSQSQTFTGSNVFEGTVSIGDTLVGAPLAVRGTGTQGDQLRLQNGSDNTRMASLGVNTNSDLFIQTHHSGVGAAGNVILEAGFPSGGFPGGKVGIGTRIPAVPLQVDGGTDVSPSGGGYIVAGATNSLNVAFDNNEIMARNNGAAAQLFINAAGGNVAIGVAMADSPLRVDNARCDGNNWINASDRNLKENFTAVDPLNVLSKVAALPITQWNYKGNPNGHLGPVAQDFHAAFGLNGDDDKGIATVDEGGVALAAIQGLNEKVEGQSQKSEARIQKLETENAQLKLELCELKKLVGSLSVQMQRSNQ